MVIKRKDFIMCRICFIPVLLLSILAVSCGDGGLGPSPGSSMVGWAVGSVYQGPGLILHTTDGGNNWNRQESSAIPEMLLEAVFAVDSLCAWVVSGSDGGYATILRTLDGGATWTRIGSSATILNTSLNAVFAFSIESALVAGGNNAILYTNDGGNSWISISDAAYDTFTYDDVYAIDPGCLWVVGGDGADGIILHTTDGGMQWESQGNAFLLDSFPLISVSAVNADTAWTVGHGHTVAKTTDGGQNWELCVPDSLPRTTQSDDANGIVALPSGWTLVGMDYGKAYITEDGGTTWTKQDVPTAELLLGCCSLNQTYSWIAAQSMNATGGCIVATSNGGSSWTLQYSSDIQTICDVSFVGAQH